MKSLAAPKARAYLDRFENVVRQMGMPPGLGRLVGWLMIAEPACQTIDEIARTLDVSEEMVSRQMDMLVATQSVDRVEIPGKGEPCFALRSPAQLLQRRNRQLAELRGILDEGIDLVGNESPEVRERLEAFRTLYARFGDMLEHLNNGIGQTTP